MNRRFLGIDKEEQFLEIARNRRREIDDIATKLEYRKRIVTSPAEYFKGTFELREKEPDYGSDLPIE